MKFWSESRKAHCKETYIGYIYGVQMTNSIPVAAQWNEWVCSLQTRVECGLVFIIFTCLFVTYNMYHLQRVCMVPSKNIKIEKDQQTIIF